MKFSYKLQELRKGSGMSQEEFAELLGVSRQSVSKWESGRAYPEIDKLIFISDYFNTSLDLLLKDETDSSSMPSESTSTQKNKTKIDLNKPQDQPAFEPSAYASDPLPKHTPQSYQLRSVRVGNSTQVRPMKKYKFGNKRLSHKGLVTLSIVCGVAVIGSIVGISGWWLSNREYMGTDSVTFEDVTEYDYNDFDDLCSYGEDYSWGNLYDGDTSSILEQDMLSKMYDESQSVLVDANGTVYYSGYETIGVYINTQAVMQESLSCTELYKEYLSFEQNDKYLSLYSEEYDQWVIINSSMVYTQLDNYSNTVSVPNDDYTSDYDDIISDPDYYNDCNNAPFKQVLRLGSHTNALVSSYILDLCTQAINDRKYLSMKNYIQLYESLNSDSSSFELVQYDSQVAFVPKSLIMVNADSLDEYSVANGDVEDEEVIEQVEIVNAEDE